MSSVCKFSSVVPSCPGLLNSENEDLTPIGQSGLKSIHLASSQRGDPTLEVSVGDKVHKSCRSIYINQKAIQQYIRKKRKLDIPLDNDGDDDDNIQAKKNRIPLSSISENVFKFEGFCFLCGNRFNFNRKQGALLAACSSFATTCLKRSILATIEFRKNDAWSCEVQNRIASIQDLSAVKAQYHKVCLRYFDSGREKPERKGRVSNSRPKNSDREEAFQRVAERFRLQSENNIDFKSTLPGLIIEMEDALFMSGSDEEAYCPKTMLKEMQKHFENDIIINNEVKPCELLFRKSLLKLLKLRDQEKHSDKKKEKVANKDSKLQEAVKLVAKAIRNEMKDLDQNLKTYPKACQLNDIDEQLRYVPSTLQHLLQELFQREKVDLQVASIGQAITQICMPRTIFAPLMWAVGCVIHHEFRTRTLVELIHALGFSVSYDEVRRYEANAAIAGASIISNAGLRADFILYAADNADHNIATIDGFLTFHGMGMIGAVFPASNEASSVVVKRGKVTIEELKKVGTVPIKFYSCRSNEFQRTVFQYLSKTESEDPEWYAEIIWRSSFYLRQPTPNWSGMMQTICKGGKHTGPTSRLFLPMIDLNPSDETCIFSTLSFIVDHANKSGVKPVLTFDQPLFWKALSITINEEACGNFSLREMVLLLGGFHTRMSFLSSMSHVMKGSGLSQVFEQIFAPNAVKHILSGKAVARAERAHFLTECALNTLIMEEAYDSETSNSDSKDIQDLMGILEELLAKDCTPQDVVHYTCLRKVQDRFSETVREISNRSRTGKLWIQYLDMVNILRSFRRSELTGNWLLHLQSLERMLPYFAATGHNNYLKAAWLYLQRMKRLEVDHPKVYDMFMQGYFVIRRVDEYWGAVACDLYIEQELMRNLKSRWGLTRGSGMSEVQRVTWLLSRPICSEVSANLRELCGKYDDIQRRNVDFSASRLKRDNSDINKLLVFLRSANVFTGLERLRSIATGLEARPHVNADEAEKVGLDIISNIVGKSLGDVKLSRKNQVVTLDASPVVSCGKKQFSIDPVALFQKIVAINRHNATFPDMFRYELCSVPSALFDDNGILRDPNKSSMKAALISAGGLSYVSQSCLSNSVYVLDGGSLLHTIRWPRGKSYSEVIKMYVDYVKSSYGEKTHIIFDGYSREPSTKDEAHSRRYGTSHRVPFIEFRESDETLKQDEFLSNPENKARFISLLAESLRKEGHYTSISKDDADIFIVFKAIDEAENRQTVVVADDTDILVLLLHHLRPTSKEIFMIGNSSKINNGNILHINYMERNLGPRLKNCILFLHAFLGCDTTSRIFNIRRGDVLQKARTSDELREISSVFSDPSSHRKAVQKAGIDAFIIVYGGSSGITLNRLRYETFVKKAYAATKVIEPNVLPPTEDAASLHSLRVYYQIQVWAGHFHHKPTDFGWTLEEGRLRPIRMTLPPAPDDLIKKVRCNCKGDCDTARCSCRRMDRKCSRFCGQCQGINCSNAKLLPVNDPSDKDMNSDPESDDETSQPEIEATLQYF